MEVWIELSWTTHISLEVLNCSWYSRLDSILNIYFSWETTILEIDEYRRIIIPFRIIGLVPPNLHLFLQSHRRRTEPEEMLKSLSWRINFWWQSWSIFVDPSHNDASYEPAIVLLLPSCRQILTVVNPKKQWSRLYSLMDRFSLLLLRTPSCLPNIWSALWSQTSNNTTIIYSQLLNSSAATIASLS